jgi:hypothetical protein
LPVGGRTRGTVRRARLFGIAWAKLGSLVEGARLASRELWK